MRNERFFFSLLALALAVACVVTRVVALPANPGGIDFSVVGCTGIYKIDPDTFVVDCTNDTVTISTLTVNGDSTFLGSLTTSGTFTFSGPLSFSGFTHYGSTANVNIQSLVCTGGVGACAAVSLSNGDLYISTGSTAGQFRNARTGTGP